MQINFHPATGTPYPVPAPMRFRDGLGNLGASSCAPTSPNQTPDAGSIAAIAAQGAATTGGILAALSSSTLAILGPEFALAGPIGAAVAALTAVGLAIANEFQGCGQTCVQASCIANNVEDYLKQNLGSYLSSPIHYRSLQTAALNNFDTGWNALVTACGAAALQQAGQNCISDRKQSSCAYRTTPGGWQQNNGVWTYVPPGQNNSGSTCWNWFVGYRDPIANDPTVVPDPTGSTASFNSAGQEVVTSTPTISSTSGTSSLPIPLILGGLLLGFMAMEN